MKQLLPLFVVVALLPCATAMAAGNILFNGNLDQTYPELIVDNPDPGPPFDFYLPKPLGWVNEGTRTLTGPYEDELSSEPWAGPAPTPVTTDGSGFPSPDGCNGLDCGVFFKAFSGNVANGPATGHLYQDNPATPGMKYILMGWAGAEANFLAAGAEIALEFLDGGGGVIGGDVINLLPTLYIDNGEAFDYKKYTAMGVAPAGAVTVRARASMIDGIPNPLGGGQAFVVDDFTLMCVPEPASAALVLIGLCGMLGLVRRR